MSLVFKCAYCDVECDTEEKRNSHSLFVHFKLTPTCSNNELIEKDLKEIEDLRKRWKKIMKRIKYYERTYKDLKNSSPALILKTGRDLTKLHKRYFLIRYERAEIVEIAQKKGILLEV